MKTIVRLLLLAVLVAGGTGAAVAGGDHTALSAFCRDHGDFGLSHGACVAQLAAENTTPHNAEVCQLDWVRAWVRAENEGQCVKTLNAMMR